MKTSYWLKLDKNNRKHVCPACGRKRYIRYIDIDTGEYIPIQYGRCERGVHCGYRRYPQQGGYVKKKIYWQQWRLDKKRRENRNNDNSVSGQE